MVLNNGAGKEHHSKVRHSVTMYSDTNSNTNKNKNVYKSNSFFHKQKHSCKKQQRSASLFSKNSINNKENSVGEILQKYANNNYNINQCEDNANNTNTAIENKIRRGSALPRQNSLYDSDYSADDGEVFGCENKKEKKFKRFSRKNFRSRYVFFSNLILAQILCIFKMYYLLHKKAGQKCI